MQQTQHQMLKDMQALQQGQEQILKDMQAMQQVQRDMHTGMARVLNT
jgi:hypothetical protein